jgi:hypothetical protein
MPQSVRFNGRSIYRPGTYTHIDLTGLANLDLGAAAAVVVVGEADAGQHQATATTPVYHTFTDPQDMIDTFQSGNLAEVATCLFKPALDGQKEGSSVIRGCDIVYAIKTNASTQASYTVQDGSANNAFTLKDRIWGLQGNNTWFKIETSGTGFTLTIGRSVAPNIGSQTSGNFSITGTDEWLELGITGAFTGASCTVDFDGTTLSFDSSVGTEDLSITVTGKTMTEVINEINAFAPITTACYSATLLRANRANVLADYMDQATALDIFAANKKMWGVSYDVVTWVNASSSYCQATWVAGYDPQMYTQTYLTGGTTGVSTTTTIQDALKTAKKINTRFIASAYNDDVGAAGAIVLATVNGYFTDHLNQCNPIGGRVERQGFGCTNSTTKANLWTELQAINNEWYSVTNNTMRREDPNGVIGWLGAHCVAACAAGIAAGSPVATPLTQKYIRAYDFATVATDFDDGVDLDFQNGIENGLLFLEPDPGVGIRFAKGITTYKTEDNDGYTMIEVVGARLWLHRLMRLNMEKPFIGAKGRGIRSANAYRGRALKVLQAASNQESDDFILIDGTDSDGNAVPPYRNVRVTLVGDQIYLKADVTFTQGINWTFNEFRATLPSALAA